MQNRTPTQLPVPEFEPVPRKFRYDGWTPERQRGFIAALAETGSVKAACRQVNMSQVGAYYLRRQPGADGFRAAWNAALDHGVQRLEDIAMTRAIEGVAYPVFGAKGQIGTRRSYNDRLLMFILRHRIPHRFGPLKPLPPGTRHPDTLSREEQEAAEAEAQAARDEAWATVNGAIHNLVQLLATLREAWIAAGRAQAAGEAERAEAIDAIAARMVWHLFEGPGAVPLFHLVLEMAQGDLRNFICDDEPTPSDAFHGFTEQAMYRWDELVGEGARQATKIASDDGDFKAVGELELEDELEEWDAEEDHRRDLGEELDSD